MTHGRVPTDLRALYYLLMRIEPKKDMDAMWATHSYIKKISNGPTIQIYKWSAKLRTELVEYIMGSL